MRVRARVEVGANLHVITLRHDEPLVGDPGRRGHVGALRVDDELVTDVGSGDDLGAAAEGTAEDVDATRGEGQGEDEGDERHHGHLG